MRREFDWERFIVLVKSLAEGKCSEEGAFFSKCLEIGQTYKMTKEDLHNT